MKFGKAFAIKTKPCYKLSECLNAYKKEQLLLLADYMKFENEIEATISKEELVKFLYINILERLEYIFLYSDPYDFIITSAFSKEDDSEKGHFLEVFTTNFGEGAETQIMLSNMHAIQNGIMFVFAEDDENPVLVVPDEVKEKIMVLIKQAKNNEFEPGEMNPFLQYCEVLSNLYGICTPDVFMQIYKRDYPKVKIAKEDLETCFIRAASISRNFIYENNMIQSDMVDKQFVEYILKDRKNFSPYIPSEDELYDHMVLADYDEDNPAFVKFVNFLNKELEDDGFGEEAALDIIPLIKVFYPIQAVVEYIQKNYEILSEKKSFEKFLPIYQELVNTSHLWSNWGHTPESLRTEDGNLKKSAYSEEFLDELKKKRENCPHIELPADCVVPSDDEIKKAKKEFETYWGKNETEPAWHKDGDRVLSRIMKDIKSNLNVISQFPESTMNQLFDQWLASVYHANVNKPGVFGNQKWKYYAFEIAEKLRDGLYTCFLTDGIPIVIAAPGFDSHFENDNCCCLTVLVDMGGWYLTYGPQLVWKGLQARDIEVLASSVASQTFDLKGLTGVIHFNPVPFWCAQRIATIPSMVHKGVPVIQCYAETSFLNEEIPVFPAKWEHEVSEKSSGKFERWILNKDDYLGSCTVYHDKKTGTVLLYSCNEDLFDKTFSEFSKYFNQKNCTTLKMSMILAPFIKNNKKEKLLGKFEKGF